MKNEKYQYIRGCNSGHSEWTEKVRLEIKKSGYKNRQIGKEQVIKKVHKKLAK